MSAYEELFGDLPDYLAKGALVECHDLHLGPDEVVMSAGDDDAALIYIVEGEVSVRRGGVEIDTSGPGEVIGEMAMFRSAPRVAEVVTREPTRALIFTREAYDKLVDGNNPIAFRLERMILKQLGQRLRRLDALVGKNSAGSDDPYKVPPKSFFTQLKEALTGKVKETPVVERDLNRAEVLDESHLFRGERFTLVEGLAMHTEHYVWTAGQTLCEQGEKGDAIYVIAEGNADVYVRTKTGKVHKLGSVGPGACVGMTSLVDGRPRMATVVATEQVDALELPKGAFDGLVEQDGQIQSALRRALIRAFAEQIDEAGANLVSLAAPEVSGEVTANVTTEIYAR